MFKKIWILLIALTLAGPASTVFAWTIKADFEQGNVNDVAEGPSAFDSAGSRTTFTNERARSGSQSVKFDWRAGDTGFSTCKGYIDYPQVNHGDEIWFRTYWYFESPWAWDTGASNGAKLMRLQVGTSSGDHIGYPSVYFDNDGEITLAMDGPLGYRKHSQVPFGLDQWVCIEMYVKFSSSNGIVRMWRNGELILEEFENTMMNSTDVSNLAFLMSYWNSGVPQNQTNYADDIIITTETPNNTDANGNPFIGPNGDVADDGGSNDGTEEANINAPSNFQIVGQN